MFDTIQDFIDYAKSKGFEVYAPENIKNYFYVIKDNKIGYFENDRLIGPLYLTIHKPNNRLGTGYRVDNIEDILLHSPTWARSAYESIVKYKSKEEFINGHWCKLIKY